MSDRQLSIKRVGWADVKVGDSLTDGRIVVDVDVRSDVSVLELDDGTILHAWRWGPNSPLVSSIAVFRSDLDGDS